MRRVLATVALLAGGLGCGGPEPAAVAFGVRIDALLRDEVASLSVYVLGPRRSDNIQLTCSTLMSRAIDPTDKRVDELARVDVVFTEPQGREVTLENVEPGQLRLVYVEARDATKTLIANGCVERINVKEGSTVPVDVPVYRLP